MDNWTHVTLASNRVERLAIGWKSYLKGPIPPALGGLTKLEDLTFEVTDQLNGAIPPELGSLSALKRLILRYNQLSGAVPRELGGLANLTDLRLSSNQLSGSLPDELGQLAKMLYLSLPKNKLSGSLPWELGKLSELEEFVLYENTLSGVIPPWLDKLTKLRSLSLSDNDFTPGPIPYVNPTPLQRLSLYTTNRTGSLPQRLETLTKLLHLRLHDNDLSGTIPSALGNLTDLTILSLHDNNLSGTIPTTWGSATHPLSNLRRLDLRNNDLSGAIPTNLGNLGEDTDGTTRNLDRLRLSGNQLSGPIPADLNKLAGLRELYLHDNLLTGPIPSAFDANTNLDSLYAFKFDDNESVCLPATLDDEWYDTLSIRTEDGEKLQDKVEVHCAFTTPNALTLAPGPTSLSLSWNAYSSTGFTTSAYEIQYRPGTTGKWETVTPTIAAPTTTTKLTELDPNQSYQVRYRALDDIDTTTPTRYTGTKWSSAGSATVPAVTLTSSNVTATGATLTLDKWPHEWWYKGSQSGATCTPVTAETSGTKIVQINTLTHGTGYTYKAYRATGCADADEITTESFTTLTVNLQAAATGTTSGTLTIQNWTAAWWYKRTTPTGDDTCHPVLVTDATAPQPLDGLTASTDYTYKAYKATGCASADEIATGTFTTDDPPPPVTNPGGGGGGGGGGGADPVPPQGYLESPAHGAVVSGIDIIRGWSFAEVRGVRIAQVELYLDGRREAVIPCCSTRPDVAAAKPDFPRANTSQSGWGITTNWGNLSPGRHTVRVRVTSTDEGRWFSEPPHHHRTQAG